MTRGEEIIKEAELCASANTQIIGDWGEHYLGFIHGAEWADAHPHWISVEDKLPKDGEYVLICNRRGLMTTSLYENKEWIISETYLAVNVTHWLPLPQPPKKGGEE